MRIAGVPMAAAVPLVPTIEVDATRQATLIARHIRWDSASTSGWASAG